MRSRRTSRRRANLHVSSTTHELSLLETSVRAMGLGKQAGSNKLFASHQIFTGIHLYEGVCTREAELERRASVGASGSSPPYACGDIIKQGYSVVG